MVSEFRAPGLGLGSAKSWVLDVWVIVSRGRVRVCFMFPGLRYEGLEFQVGRLLEPIWGLKRTNAERRAL